MRPAHLFPILASVSLLACDRPFGDPTEVASLYWAAMADADVDKARGYATAATVGDVDVADEGYTVHEIQLVAADVRGERATVPTRIDVTAGSIQFVFEFETTLVKQGRRWRVDAELTNAGLAEGVLQATLGGSLDGLGELFGNFIGEMVGGVMEGVGAALEDAADALDRVDHQFSYSYSTGTSSAGDWGRFDPGALGEPIVSLTGLGDDETVSAAFTLTRAMDLRVIALGEGTGNLVDYGWIVNQRTRERVWQMDYHETGHAGGAEKNRFVDALIGLDAGTYVAYFITDDSHSFEEWNSNAPNHGSLWGMTIVAASPSARSSAVPYVPQADPSIIARIDQVRDDQSRSVRFTLGRTTEVRLYALGEGDNDGMYDYAWIESAGTGEVSWVMDYDDTDWAGGADKNRVVDATIRLTPGEYVLRYRSDGSHSFSDWNDSPPNDPTSWGVTVYQTGR